MCVYIYREREREREKEEICIQVRSYNEERSKPRCIGQDCLPQYHFLRRDLLHPPLSPLGTDASQLDALLPLFVSF